MHGLSGPAPWYARREFTMYKDDSNDNAKRPTDTKTSTHLAEHRPSSSISGISFSARASMIDKGHVRSRDGLNKSSWESGTRRRESTVEGEDTRVANRKKRKRRDTEGKRHSSVGSDLEKSDEGRLVRPHSRPKKSVEILRREREERERAEAERTKNILRAHFHS
jgi:hypothetical protein